MNTLLECFLMFPLWRFLIKWVKRQPVFNQFRDDGESVSFVEALEGIPNSFRIPRIIVVALPADEGVEPLSRVVRHCIEVRFRNVQIENMNEAPQQFEKQMEELLGDAHSRTMYGPNNRVFLWAPRDEDDLKKIHAAVSRVMRLKTKTPPILCIFLRGISDDIINTFDNADLLVDFKLIKVSDCAIFLTKHHHFSIDDWADRLARVGNFLPAEIMLELMTASTRERLNFILKKHNLNPSSTSSQ